MHNTCKIMHIILFCLGLCLCHYRFSVTLTDLLHSTLGMFKVLRTLWGVKCRKIPKIRYFSSLGYPLILQKINT